MEHDLKVLDKEAEKIVRDLGIPPCPAILTKLLTEMRVDEPDYKKISKLIGGDVSLAASMLKTVNSPFFGLRTKATTVQQALTLLGLRNVSDLVTGLLLRMAFSVDKSAAMEQFWNSSSGVAQITAKLARSLAGADRDEAFTFALFRDCGVPLMMRKYPEYAAFFKGASNIPERMVTEEEDAHFGMDHARVGYQLAVSWHLADETCIGILRHHDYAGLCDAEVSPSSRKLVALALVAEQLYTKSEVDSDSPEWIKGGNFALETLGVDESALDEYAEEAGAALAE